MITEESNIQNPGGRPTKYKASFCEQAYKLCLLGATDQEIADFFEVNVDTINEWKKKHNGFSVSIKKGKTIADAEVANKLFTRASGYKYDEVTYEKIEPKGSEGENIKIDLYQKKVVMKEVAPDVTAQIFWLKNRQRNKWKDKQTIDFNDLPEEALDYIIEQLKNASNGK